MFRKALFALILFFLTLALHGAEPFLLGEFVYNMNLDLKSTPFPGMTTEEFENKPGEDYEEQIYRTLLEEARWVFSAMIYGLTVSYTPSDIAREVDRLYDAELTARIPFGDSRLHVYDTFVEDNVFHAFIRYELDPYQKRRVEYWESGVFDSGASYGYWPYFGENSRINAIKDGIRIALENQLKPEIYNKPRQIEAEVILRECPLISVDSGKNRAFVKIRSHVKNLQTYRVNN
ncbi:MAG: hypothetical protein JXR86_08140 [Spirochaetales bacterium]|nr:hypothetical protein [Spirochaetales bacterium]